MPKPPDFETILTEREVADLRRILEETMTEADKAGEVQLIWPTVAGFRALCDSHEVLRAKLRAAE